MCMIRTLCKVFVRENMLKEKVNLAGFLVIINSKDKQE